MNFKQILGESLLYFCQTVICGFDQMAVGEYLAINWIKRESVRGLYYLKECFKGFIALQNAIKQG